MLHSKKNGLIYLLVGTAGIVSLLAIWMWVLIDFQPPKVNLLPETKQEEVTSVSCFDCVEPVFKERTDGTLYACWESAHDEYTRCVVFTE